MQRFFYPQQLSSKTGWLAILLLTILLQLFLTACSTKPKAKREPLSRYQVTDPGQELETGFYQQGIASWYGHPFHGCATASGEIYDMHALTAAHKDLPLGSRVLVTNLENHLQLEVVINDRGPFIKNRIIDLSLAGARRLKMEKNGTAMVRLDITGLPEKILGSVENPFAIQFGAFKNRAQAVSLKKKLAQVNSKVFIEKVSQEGGSLYRVRLGWFSSRDVARREARRIGRRDAHVFRR